MVCRSRIHHILGTEGFKVSLKRVQRRMTELSLCAITVKKYKPHSSKKVVEDLENVLKRDFTTSSINEKWVGDIQCHLVNKMTLKLSQRARDKNIPCSFFTKKLDKYIEKCGVAP